MASVFANSSDWTRMGQFVIGFQTSEFIPPEKGAENYSIDSIKLTLITPGEPSFQYDSTYDLFETYTGEDSDEGRPIVRCARTTHPRACVHPFARILDP